MRKRAVPTGRYWGTKAMGEYAYFDNGATTFPKPPSVVKAVEECLCECCGNAGRGSHRAALTAARRLYDARVLVCELFSCPSPDGVVFTYNATYALNMAILGLVEKGGHVVISDLEHNSVVRPLEYLKRTANVSYSIFSTKGDILANIRSALRADTVAMICVHASNVTNRVLPIERIGRLLSTRRIRFIVDASQSAGTYPVNMERARISALCMAGHKGLLGPQGVGLAIFSPDCRPRAVISGGTGVMSRSAQMPALLPEGLEAGTVGLPAVAGLCAGMTYVKERGVADIRRRESELMDSVRRALEGDKRIRTFSEGEGPIWLFNVKGKSPQQAARLLDSFGVAARPGLHCAPLAHQSLGTPEDGALRVSAGPFNTREDAERLVLAVRSLL